MLFLEGTQPVFKRPLDRLLERSGDRLLNLTFNFRSSQKRSLSQHEVYALLQQTIPHRTRWRKFVLAFDGEPEPLSYIQDFLSPSQTPNLESLIILPRSIGWDTHPLDGFCDKDPAWPQRKAFYLCLNGNSAPTCSSFLSQATSLRLDATWSWPKYGYSSIQQVNWISWSVFQRILSSSSLASLSIQGQPFRLPDISEKTTAEIIEMPHVKHLRYTSCEGSSIFEDFILPSLSAPNLESLTLERMDPPDDPNHWVPEKLRPLSSVKSLHLVDFVAYDSEFMSSLAQLTPSVTHLVLTGGQPVKTVLSHVARQGLWKSMETLTIHGPQRSKSYVGAEVIQKALDLLLHEQRTGPTRYQS